jgi:hypothetical protein
MELAGPQGADFYLYPGEHHTAEDIEAAKEEIRTEHDVVGLYVIVFKGEYPLPRYPETWTPEQREKGFRDIVASRSMAQVENCICVDLFTASYVVQVIDGINPKNKEKFLSMDALTMIETTWKVFKKVTIEPA